VPAGDVLAAPASSVAAELVRVAPPLPGIVTADFRGNGVLDLAIANKDAKTVSVMLGRGDGTFEGGAHYFVGGSGPDALLVADFNGDSFLDLAGLAVENNGVFLLLGNGDGTFRGSALSTVGRLGLSTPQATKSSQPLRAISSPAPSSPPVNPGGGAGGARESVGDRHPALIFPSGGMPPASALPGSEGEIAVGVPEGPELVLFLTSFGIAVPLARLGGPRPSLADVFVINGPGFLNGLDLPMRQGEPEGHRLEVPAKKDTPPQPPPVTLNKRLVSGGFRANGVASGLTETSIDEAAWSGFQMILDDVFRPERLDGLPGKDDSSADAAQPATGPLSDAISLPSPSDTDRTEPQTHSADE
jgi:hypothetical protein